MLLLRGINILGGVISVFGLFVIVMPFVLGQQLFESVLIIEPTLYIGLLALIVGLLISSGILFIMRYIGLSGSPQSGSALEDWSVITQQYFELFQHDLGRPFRRILGKERELRLALSELDSEEYSGVKELFDEIEGQAPNFRLMMSNVQVLIQMESPSTGLVHQPTEPAEIIRRIVDRYTFAASDRQKEITWWAEPEEFGILYSDASAIEHIVTNLVDNAVRFAGQRIEIRLSKDSDQFRIAVWDDGPGIVEEYTRHIFERGWTPELAKREERTSSGLGMFISSTLAKRNGGDLTVSSVVEPDPKHHTEFSLTLPAEQYEK